MLCYKTISCFISNVVNDLPIMVYMELMNLFVV